MDYETTEINLFYHIQDYSSGDTDLRAGSPLRL